MIPSKSLEKLDDLRGESPAASEKILREIFGYKVRPTMKHSPLLGRLQRMKGEIDRGHESLDRKLRYLLWLN